MFESCLQKGIALTHQSLMLLLWDSTNLGKTSDGRLDVGWASAFGGAFLGNPRTSFGDLHWQAVQGINSALSREAMLLIFCLPSFRSDLLE